jgi:hypothetical protein
MLPIGGAPDSAHDGATVSGAPRVSAPLVMLQARAKLVHFNSRHQHGKPMRLRSTSP